MNVYICDHCGCEVTTSADLACCPVCEGAGQGVVVSRDTEQLRRFAQRIMRAWPEGGIDGGELQDAAIECGLLQEVVPAPLEPCGSTCRCADYYAADEFEAGEVECYRPTRLLAGQPASDSDNELARTDSIHAGPNNPKDAS